MDEVSEALQEQKDAVRSVISDLEDLQARAGFAIERLQAVLVGINAAQGLLPDS